MTVADEGRSIELGLGQVVTVSLDNTYWQLATIDRPDVLETLGDPQVVKGSCGPGEGCGTVSQTYRAIGPGTAIVRASRVACGEALACSSADASYEVTFVVH